MTAPSDSPVPSSSVDAWAELWQELAGEAERIRQGGGSKAIERQHSKGRLTARERLELLLDPGAPVLELGL
ncbi:MAG TPA: acyl-CoA carboxylase subunit beta, partial [Planctomycetaceae bacterium]|nr:acyl-CoA carboxylase subunit beta [Planctomycetaceae bacterium]